MCTMGKEQKNFNFQFDKKFWKIMVGNSTTLTVSFLHEPKEINKSFRSCTQRPHKWQGTALPDHFPFACSAISSSSRSMKKATCASTVAAGFLGGKQARFQLETGKQNCMMKIGGIHLSPEYLHTLYQPQCSSSHAVHLSRNVFQF